MNQIIYGDDLTNNEHPFTKGMKELVKNLNAVECKKTPFFVVFLIYYQLRIIIVMRNYN